MKKGLSQNASNKQSGQYIWRTVGDDKVRDAHKGYDGQVFSWNNPPEGGNPGEDYNCRCWADPIEDGINRVYPEFIIVPTLRGVKGALTIIRSIFSGMKDNNFTSHGKQRANQRGISSKEIQNAMKSAEKSGNVKSKTGRYGTKQKQYDGTNGITVIVEQDGRNAGKIITVWRR
ncbi:MAG: phage minor head protein [Alphaproteobacteria bacterium]